MLFGRFLGLGAVACSLTAFAACAGDGPAPAPAAAPMQVRVLTFNMWHGGDAGGQPLEQSVAVVRASGADIVGLQETHGRERDGQRPDHGARMANLLGWHYLDQGHRTGILSRWPIAGTHGEGAGVTVRLPSGRELHVFNVHLAHAPYQPYQLLRIPYEDAPFLTTANEAVEAATSARGRQIADVLAIVRPLVDEGALVVLTGDFNEPSHLDWTPRAASAGVVPLAVPFPTSRAVVEAGLRDAFRTRFADEVSRPGWTWTPTTRPDDRPIVTTASTSCTSAPVSSSPVRRRRWWARRRPPPTSSCSHGRQTIGRWSRRSPSIRRPATCRPPSSPRSTRR